MTRFLTIRAAFIAAITTLLFSAGLVTAQITTLPNATGFINMMIAQGKLPAVTGGSIGLGSTDAAGIFIASATSGTIVFNDQNGVQPLCVVTDSSASPVAVYGVAAVQITLTTIVSGHVYFYHCIKRVI